MKETIYTMLKGAAMGVAEAIPGVSGGTLAFITGIYERLLNAISNINLGLLKTWKEEGFKRWLVSH
jgi:putative membrane protein